jgi:hypothetical protein
MTTISVYGDSPGAPSPMLLASWDEGFHTQGATRTSVDDADPTTYDDPGATITDDVAQQIVGQGWYVSIA